MELKPVRGSEEADQEPAVISLVVGDDGRLVLPAAVVEEAGPEPGDTVEVERTLHGMLVAPVRTEAEMEAFWGPDWRQKLDEARADVAAGRTTLYALTEEFLASLESRT